MEKGRLSGVGYTKEQLVQKKRDIERRIAHSKRIGPEVSDMPDFGEGGFEVATDPQPPTKSSASGGTAPTPTTTTTTTTTIPPTPGFPQKPAPGASVPTTACRIGAKGGVGTYTISGTSKHPENAGGLIENLGKESARRDPGMEVVHQMLDAMDSEIQAFVVCVLGNLGETDNNSITKYWTNGNILNFAAAAIERQITGSRASAGSRESVNVFINEVPAPELSRPHTEPESVPIESTSARISSDSNVGAGIGSDMPSTQPIGVLQSDESCVMGVWDRSSSAATPKPINKGEVILQQLLSKRTLSTADVEAWKALYGKNETVFGKGQSMLSGMSQALTQDDEWVTMGKALLMTFMQPLMLAAVKNATMFIIRASRLNVSEVQLMTHRRVMSFFAMFVASYIGKAKIRSGNIDRKTQLNEWNQIYSSHAELFKTLMYGIDGELCFAQDVVSGTAGFVSEYRAPFSSSLQRPKRRTLFAELQDARKRY